MASIVGIVLIRPYNDGGNNNTPRRNSCCSGNWRPKGLETKRNLFHFALKWFLCGSCRHPNCGLRLFEWAWQVGNFSSSPFLCFRMANLKFNGLKEVIEFWMPSTSISDNSNVFPVQAARWLSKIMSIIICYPAIILLGHKSNRFSIRWHNFSLSINQFASFAGYFECLLNC